MGQSAHDPKGLAAGILDGMLAPVALLDAKGQIVLANRAFRSGTPSTVEGANYFEICAEAVGIRSEDLGDVRGVVGAVLQGSGDITLELPYERGLASGWYGLRVTRLDIGGQSYVALFHSNVSHRKSTQAALQSSEAERAVQHQIVEHISESVISCDLNGVVTSWNPGAERLFGHTREEMIGKSIFATFPGETRQSFAHQLNVLKQTGALDTECVRRHKNGNLFHAHTSLSYLRNEAGEPTGIIGYTMDVTEKRRITEELEASLSQLEAAVQTANELSIAARAASKAKSEFLANVSHEIRTPMNGIVGMTELLLNTKLDSEQLDFAKTIQHSAGSLLRVLNDVLDFSKIEAGKLAIESQPFDLRELMENVVDLMAPQAQAKSLDMSLRVAPECPVSLSGDSLRIRQILTNLLNNAIKFTDEGEVQVSVEAVEETGESALIRFQVIDTGVGIPEDRQNAIFDSFTQADASTTRKHGGTGLGLAICKNLANLMGGEIGVSSVEGSGAKFWVDLSLTTFPQVEIPRFHSLPACEGKRFLIIDRSAGTRRIIRETLELWGATVIEASGIHDLEMREVTSFDVVIADEVNAAPLFSSGRVIGIYPLGMKPEALSPYAGVLQRPVKVGHLYDAVQGVFESEGGLLPHNHRFAA